MSSPVALVTGGGSGIGLGVTEHLINHHGYRVAIIDIEEARVEEESSRLRSHNCLGIHADITNYDQQAQAFLQAFEWGGNRLDLFFANAGIGDKDSLYKDSAIDSGTGLPKPLNLRTIDVNLNAVLQGVHLARHFFSEKNSKPGGHILATSSVVGLYSNHPMPLYAASKHGVVGVVRSLAPVYAKDNITVNAILPTLIHTNLMRKDVTTELNQPAQTTPMSTALKAVDAILSPEQILGQKMLTGQIMELALEDVVFKPQPAYSRENTRWMFQQSKAWEMVCESVMPRPPGENAVVIEVPTKEVNERAVTKQCLRICEDAKAHVEFLSNGAPHSTDERSQTVLDENSFGAQVRTRQVLEEHRDSFVETIGYLRRRLEPLVRNEGSGNESERSRLLSDIDISKQCLDLYKAASEASRQRIYRIGEVIADNRSDQVVVTTLADLFDVKKALSRGSSAQLVGSMTREDLQRLTEKRYDSRFGAVAGDSDRVQVGISNTSVSPIQNPKNTSPPQTDSHDQYPRSRTTHTRPSPNEMRKRLSGGGIE